MAPRETENNTYAKFWGDKQRALWYVMVFSGVVNSNAVVSGSFWYPCTRHLCTRFRIDGIKAMSRGILGGKRAIAVKFV